MNPLKSLMALGLAFGLSRAAYCVEQKTFDNSAGGQTQQSSGKPEVPQAKPTPVAGAAGAADKSPLNAVSAAIHAKGASAVEDVASRFAQYLAQDQYVKDSYLTKAKEQQVEALEGLEKAVASAVEKAQPADNAKMSKDGELAALYIMIGPGDDKPAWLDERVVKGLAGQKARGGTWPARFEKGMSCWRGQTADGVNCGPNEGPFAGNAGAKDVETALESWAQGVTSKALAVAEEVVANDALGEKEIQQSIDDNNEGVSGIGGGKGDKAGFSPGKYGADDMYVQGADFSPCFNVGNSDGCGRNLSIKLTYDRDPMGNLIEAVTFCDVGSIDGDGIHGASGCKTVQVNGDAQDAIIAGGNWHLGFWYSDACGGDASFTAALKGGNVKKTVCVSDLRQKLGQQAQDWADQGRCKARIGEQNYVCVPFAHTMMADPGDGSAAEVARGGLLYYPADDQFKLLGKAPKPLFEADNTQSSNNGTVKLAPPATALGCAGFVTTGKGDLGRKAQFCNGGADSNDFMYLMQNDEGIFTAVTCPEAQKIYANLTCKFPVPPVKKEVAATPPAKGSEGSSAASGATGAATEPPPDKSDPNADQVWFCDTKYIADNNSYPGYSPIGVGDRWVVYARSGGENLANADRLCLNKLDMIAFSGIIDGVVPSDGNLDNAVKDSDGHGYLGVTVYVTGTTFVPYDHRSPDKGAHPAADRTGSEEGKPAFNFIDGTDWKTPITQAMTYYIPTQNLDDKVLSKVDPGHIPTIDKVAAIEFLQADRLKETNDEPEEMTVHFPDGFDAAKASGMIKDGFSLGPAQKRKQFQSDEDIKQLERGLADAFTEHKSGVKSATVRLMWEKECSAAQAMIPALTIDGETENVLVYDCATGGKFETQREYDQAHPPKNKS